MSNWNGLWLPMSDSTNASPAEYDMHLTVNSAYVQQARVDNMFVSRLIRNNTAMYQGNGSVNRTVKFTLTGGLGTETHLKNDRFTGMNINQIQREVTLDLRPRRTGIEEEYITKMFEQVDTRSDVLNQLAYALTSWDEVESMKAIVDAAKYTTSGSENTTEFLEGGGEKQLTTATAGATKALEILDAIEDVAIIWGQQGIPTEGRHVVIPPEDYWEIVKLEKGYTGATAIAGGIYGNTDIVGANRSLSQFVNIGEPIMYRGFNIWGHNLFKATYNIHLNGLQAAHTLDTNHSSRGSLYSSGDLTKVQGLIFQQDCVGKADVMSIMMEQGKVPMSTNEYINAMTWVGYGTLRPEAAVVMDIA